MRIDPALRVRVHRYTLPGSPVRLIGLERNISYHMGEDLKQRGGNEALEQSITVPVTLARPGHVYDLVTGKKLGAGATFTCNLDPWHPALLAVLPENDPAPGLVDRLLKQVP